MSYATVADMVERFGEQKLAQLTDRVNKPASTIDNSVVEAALRDAVALANGYLSKLYRLPLSDVPPVLTRMTADIAFYYLNGTRVAADAPETRNHLAAIAWLKDVAKGLVSLEAEGIAAPQLGDGSVQVNAPRRQFSRDSLRGL